MLAEPVLKAEIAPSVEPVPTQLHTGDHAGLLELVNLLKRQELTATGRFQALRVLIRQLLGPMAFASALHGVQTLRYHTAAATLEAYLS